MRIISRVENSRDRHAVTLQTNDTVHALTIPPKITGFGSSANGGELLFLALATCFCNDIYREAAKRGIAIEGVDVEVTGDFGAEGEPARNVTYRAVVISPADEATVRDLLRHTDGVAEIQNTLRVITPITLEEIKVIHPGG
jgi:uncharacterized OsmC-like protein